MFFFKDTHNFCIFIRERSHLANMVEILFIRLQACHVDLLEETDGRLD